MPNFNERYEVSPEEFDMLVYLRGHDVYYIRPSQVRWGSMKDANGDPRSFTDLETSTGEVRIHMAERNLPSLIHEYGHAIHATRFPESSNWPDWKAEAFAMLSDIRAMKMKRGLDPKERKMFAERIWGCRRDGLMEHQIGMRVAWRAVWRYKKLQEQIDYVVSLNAPSED